MANARNLVGTVVGGRYRLDMLLGEGGFGAVFRARHLAMDNDVAVKVLHAAHAGDAIQTERFELEARRSCQLKHPNTIRVFDFGETPDGALYLVMEYLAGRTLKEELRDGVPIPIARAIHILEQVFDALSEAHALGWVHRDLKPDNIFLTEVAGKRDYVKVLDFGIAKAIRQGTSQLTGTGMVIGTAAYMSPEQCYGRRLDARSDLYAMGCVAYHLLAGRPPFQADEPMGYLLQHAQTPPRDIRDAAGATQVVPDGVAEVVHKLLSKDPDARYPTAAAAIAALRSASERNDAWEYAPEVSPFDPLAVGLDPYASEPIPPTEILDNDQTQRRNGLATVSLSRSTHHYAVSAPTQKRPVWPWVASGAAAIVTLVALLLTGAGDVADEPPVASSPAAVATNEPDVVPEDGSSPVSAATDTDTSEVDAAPSAHADDAASPRDGVAVAEAEAPAARVSVTVRSRPNHARVHRGAELLGVTPIEVTWPPGAAESERTVTLSAPMYVKRRVILPSAPAPGGLEFRLERIARPAASRPDDSPGSGPKKW